MGMALRDKADDCTKQQYPTNPLSSQGRRRVPRDQLPGQWPALTVASWRLVTHSRHGLETAAGGQR